MDCKNEISATQALVKASATLPTRTLSRNHRSGLIKNILKSRDVIDLTSRPGKSTFDASLTVITASNLPMSDGNLTVYRLKQQDRFRIYSFFSCYSEYAHLLQEGNPQILSNEDILCLEVPNFISGFAIDFFMTLKFETNWKDIYFLPCSYTQKIFGEYSDDIFDRQKYPCEHRIFQNPINVSPDLLFLPYTLDNHWCLILLNYKLLTFTHYDPLRWQRDQQINQKF